MNNLEKAKKHLEFFGYEFKELDSMEGFMGMSERYGGLIIRPIGEEGKIGLRLEKYYPISIQNCQNGKELSLYAMVNNINQNLLLGTVFLYEDGGMTMSAPVMGDYDQKIFSNAIDMLHVDCEKVYDFDLESYWDNSNFN